MIVRFYAKIDYSKLLKRFGGSRRIVIAKLTIFGGNKFFLEVVNFAVGGVLLCFSFFFFKCKENEANINTLNRSFHSQSDSDSDEDRRSFDNSSGENSPSSSNNSPSSSNNSPLPSNLSPDKINFE